MNVLIIAPYDRIYPPHNGGMQRCINIIDQVSKFAETTVVSFQDSVEISKFPFINPKNLSFIKVEKIGSKINNWIFRFFTRLKYGIHYRILKRTISGPADSNFVNYYHPLKDVLRNNKFDYVVLENLSSLNAVSIIRKMQKGTRIIYDAHNFETALLNNVSVSTALSVKENEFNLHNTVDFIWVCSKIDGELFRNANNQLLNYYFIPNGASVPLFVPENKNKKFDLLFCGSMDYAPNEEGLLWFLNNCWPMITFLNPVCTMVVIGSGIPSKALCEKLKSEGVIFKGEVNDVNQYYLQSKISIVPLKQGSGTRLKIIEAMSFGVTVVSTSKGAEGIDCMDGENIIIAETSKDFTEKIMLLLNNSNLINKISSNAFQLVKEKYDWKVIGSMIQKCLQ